MKRTIQRNLASLWCISFALLMFSDDAQAQRKVIAMDIPVSIMSDTAKPAAVADASWADALDLELAYKWADAGNAWETIVTEEDPSWKMGIYRAVACYLHAGDSIEAERLLQGLTPDTPALTRVQTHLLGVTQWLKRDDRTAWRTLMQLVQRKEPFTETYHVLARIGMAQDSPSEALGWLRHTLEKVHKDQRVDIANHQIFKDLHRENAYRELIREMGAFSLAEDDGSRSAEPLPPHLRTSLEVKDFDKWDLRPKPTRSPEEGGLYYQGLFLLGEEDIQVEEE